MVKEAGNNNFFETDFVQFNSRTCSLVIEFSEDSFSFSILNQSTNTVLYTSVSDIFIDVNFSSEQQFQTIFNTEKVFGYSFGKVIVLIDNLYSTLVPSVLFDANQKESYLSFNFNMPKTEWIFLNNPFFQLEYQLVYALPKALYNILKTHFSEVNFTSSAAILLSFLHQKNVAQHYFHLHLGLKQMQCIYFENKQLQFHNLFSFDNTEEIIYNVLNVYKQLGLSNDRTILHVSGVLSEDSEKYALLYNYIKYIQFVDKPLKLNYTEKIKQIPAHYFLTHYAALV